MSTSVFSVSIPNSVRKTIQDIKEITGNHSEEKIYALLKECSMDPNETIQKLLLQETFHGVKRKHARRKKNVSSKQPGEVRWRSGTQGRGGRGGRVSFSPCFTSHDAGRGRGSGPGKENGLNQGAEKDIAHLQTSYKSKNKERSSITSSAPVIANGPTNIASGSTSIVHASNISAGSGGLEIILPYASKKNSSSQLNPGDANKPIAVGTEDSWEQPAPTSISSLVVCFSSSDPVLEASNDSRVPGAIGLKSEVGSHCPPVGSSKEWKSKPTSPTVQGPGTAGAYEVPTTAAEATAQSQPVSAVLDSEEATLKLQRKLEELHLPQRQHIILQNHIHVPESERTKLSFGSFGASSMVIMGNASGEEGYKCTTTVSETSRRIEDTIEEHSSSSAPVIANGPTNIAFGSISIVHASNISAGNGGPEISLSYAGKENPSSKLNPDDANKPVAIGTEDSWEQPAPTPISSLAVCFSSLDPVLDPSNDSRVPGAVGLKHEVGSHCPPVGSNKEWKSKPTSSTMQGPGIAGASEVPTAAAEATALSQPVSIVLDSKEATLKLQRKLEELHLPKRQHVILPYHIHVPESERTRLSFGSFGASSEVITGNANCEEGDKCSTTVSETSRRIEDTIEEHSSRFVMYCILALGLVWIASLFA